MHIWRKGVAEARANDAAECDDPTDTIVARLAVDGIALADLYSTYRLEATQRRRILDKLVSATKS